ncbi:MAG: sulfotransferase [Candidatus Jettenia sp.]|uniref:Sulfotransferase n=1 Tax=Candidatus Jettenia caeni TaxID=247490 RepID=I3IQT4_9BACT|nr:sulfotransferase [Candidatus Jettenia sp. AMX1]MBC6928202.1 sulfotransferase [Candidatus Jettenia sp.]GAB64079.1 sulfotransferase [Candidatus Jettenia caeni]KAA0248991.1 MAG: sulfotransferase [Candidatus Jettenia sp. AMX1]MCE7879591.1 sulfotransferase [Candidatus Jettenia sp. AMX1]MCQ3926950.1 sulfotransferase [Candidatus Jettenia sp.]
MRLPNFIIIGAPKSGTTSLFYYLKQHSDIYLPVRKELHYFSYECLEKNINGPGDKVTLSSLCATKKEYKSHYEAVKNERMIGDVSPSYLYFSNISEKIFSELGQIKIVTILRNPVEKAYSQYMHLVRDNHEILSFYDALMAERERMELGWSDIWRYAESSLYTERVKKYISVFGRDNIKILLFEDLVDDPEKVMRELFEFLRVDTNFCCDTSKVYNKTGKPKSSLISNYFSKPNFLKTIAKKIIPEKIRIPIRLTMMNINTGKKPLMDSMSKKYLVEYFRNDVIQLEKLTGRQLNWLS